MGLVSYTHLDVYKRQTDGYAIENGEYKIGLRSISAPVYTVEGKSRYTVGVIGMFRSTRSDECLAAVEQVCATASMILSLIHISMPCCRYPRQCRGALPAAG